MLCFLLHHLLTSASQFFLSASAQLMGILVYGAWGVLAAVIFTCATATLQTLRSASKPVACFCSSTFSPPQILQIPHTGPSRTLALMPCSFRICPPPDDPHIVIWLATGSARASTTPRWAVPLPPPPSSPSPATGASRSLSTPPASGGARRGCSWLEWWVAGASRGCLLGGRPGVRAWVEGAADTLSAQQAAAAPARNNGSSRGVSWLSRLRAEVGEMASGVEE